MKFQNASRWGTAMLAVLVGFNLMGCGGGGGGGGGDSSPTPSPIQAPAPDSVGGNKLTLHSATAETREISFLPDNTTWTELRDGNTVSGTYRYARSTDQSVAEVILTEGSAEIPLVLTFHSANSGSFVYRDQGVSGTFELQSINSPDPNEPPPSNGLAPSSLDGKTMYGTRTFTSTGPVGQTHVYTFSGNSYHDSDPPEESDGNYVYAANGDQATLTLNYTRPKSFDGDRHEWQMTFHTPTAGNFESVYTRRDGTVIVIRGNFTLEE